MHTATQPDHAQTVDIHCEGATEPVTIAIALFMMINCVLCLAAVVYGIHRYLQNWRTVRDERLRPPIYIHCVGLVFFLISCVTLCNTFLYDVFYVLCQQLAAYESPIYHMIYFCQIYTLWLVLFLRIYYIFHGGMFALSKAILYAYTVAFIVVLVACIPMFILFKLDAQDHLKLPFVIVSLCFCSSLLFTFFRKLWDVLLATGVDDALIRTTMKNALLATISICGTFVVVLVLLCRFIYDQGYATEHEIWEELVLEGAILIDISTNFLCVLLTYKFFDDQYGKICGPVHRKFTGCFKKQLDQRLLRDRSDNDAKTDTITVRTTKEKKKDLGSHQVVAIIHSEGAENEPVQDDNEVAQDEPRSPKLDVHAVSVPLMKLHSTPVPKLQDLRTNPVLEKRESLIQADTLQMESNAQFMD